MNFVFNVAKGRVAELYNRVKTGDPSGCGLVVVLLASADLEADAVLVDADSLEALFAGTTIEASNTGYERKAIAAGDIAALAPDDVNDVMNADIPDQTWTAVANDESGGIGKLLVCYSPAPASLDTDIIPLTCHDFEITPDGTDIVAQIPAAGFYEAGGYDAG
jgi:hypothetical protein